MPGNSLGIILLIIGLVVVVKGVSGWPGLALATEGGCVSGGRGLSGTFSDG